MLGFWKVIILKYYFIKLITISIALSINIYTKQNLTIYYMSIKIFINF